MPRIVLTYWHDFTIYLPGWPDLSLCDISKPCVVLETSDDVVIGSTQPSTYTLEQLRDMNLLDIVAFKNR